ncbi:TetR/AcrR family transcriptional regulator [Ornithinibacillus sp. 179-J 7C1 HS]|uniref:TetR/AcrR family transcriptional regulator n=1 Tax=Ornithinibacillus sp. 179-J 7C1 HS TaxID=3142384 RepID=UPI00399F608A
MARERKFTKDNLYTTSKKLLLNHGYEGYTFTLLANDLNISRAAIYKYYENKEELLSEYMLFELRNFINNLKLINEKDTFLDQFHALIDILFQDMSIYLIRDIGMQIQTVNKKVAKNKEELEKLHRELYSSLQDFIDIGRREQMLRENIPDSLILGIIFQTVNIPNTSGLPHHEWVQILKDVLSHGMFTKCN